MASQKTSRTSKSSDYSEIHDTPIVAPRPVARKECKEEVPDISTVSDIVDNKSPLLHSPNNFLHTKTSHTSYKKQEGDISWGITERPNAIFDPNSILPVMTYLNPVCQSCIINHAVMTNKGYNGQYGLPKTSTPILLPVGNEHSDKEMRFKSENGETTASNHKSIAYKHAHISSLLNSNEPETFHTEDIPNCCCSKNKHCKFRKSISKCEIPVSSDSRLGESRKSEETCEKETVDVNKLKDMNILCPACFRKSCACKPFIGRFSSKERNANPDTSSDTLSSIWEYLKQQDEKIDSIHEKVSNFLSQHASCLTDQPSQGNEFSNATESDIPYILNILDVHGDKITELQDQIKSLKSSEHISSPTNSRINESILNQAPIINCVQTKTYNEDIHCPYPHIVVCNEQRQKVTKTSTSTMTSFVTEKNDKVVYHKQMTVVSSMREEKEPSCLPNEHDSPTAKKNLEKEKANSKKRKSHKLNNCSPNLKSKQNVSSNSSLDTSDRNDNQVLQTSNKSEKKSKRASTKNKVDKKNVDDLAMKDNDEEEKKNSPSLKTTALKTHTRTSKHKLRDSTSPKVVDTGAIRDLRNKKLTQKISASSSSTDTEFKSTKQRQKAFCKTELDSEETETDSEEYTFVSKYGIRSKNLSKATKRYLDTYGLGKTRRSSNESDT